ncbi:MAG: hypothetical protein ABIY63_07310 [Fibrobacteria bacterium]
MQPDPVGPDGSGTGETGVEDMDLLAGATSSTNWPPEDAPTLPTWVTGSTDSILVLNFFDVSGAPLNSSGRLVLYKAGTIPAFQAPESIVVALENSGTQVIPYALLRQMAGSGADSVFFSVRVDIDTVESFLSGFLYSVKLKKFLASPFSGKADYSFNFAKRRFAIHGVADTALLKMGFTAQGKTTLCFYIPGSPFFFKVIPDSILNIGPVPIGDFPVRLLRITATEGQTGRNQLEVYEVKVASFNVDSTHPIPYKVISCGKKIFTSSLKASDSVRVD